MLEKEFHGANIILHKHGKLPPSFRALWSNPRLLNLVEQFVGPDIQGNPVWNMRTKTPQNEATTVPWHQDSAYLDNSSYNVFQLTAWIPLLDSNETNGCLQVMKGGHKTGKIAMHQGCYGDTWYVMLSEDEIQRTLGVNPETDRVTCEVPYGGMLLFSNALPHRSVNNLSQDTRFSLDFRWQSAYKPVGFYGVKEGILMRSSKDPNLVIDWDSFDAVDRNADQAKAVGNILSEFDTTISGPWMQKWEIVHHNRHTAAIKNEDGSQMFRP